MENATPLVSICCITYNHVNFIKDALESFLMQETTFPFEIIVHDDCSTDGTTEIIQEYQARHPDLIKPILQKENQWSKGKKIFPITLEHASGKFIAACDGDDYWLDPKKLQKQFDFLETNTACAICFHNVVELDEITQKKIIQKPPGFPKYTHIENILEKNYIQTCSVMYHKEHVQAIPPSFLELMMMDWPIFMLCAQKGQIGYIDETMAVYRLHTGGVWSGAKRSQNKLAVIQVYQKFLEYLGPTYEYPIFSGLYQTIGGYGNDMVDFAYQEGTSIGTAVSEVITKTNNELSKIRIPSKYKRKIKANLYLKLGFSSYKYYAWKEARKLYLLAILIDPSLCKDRGVISICTTLFFGQIISKKLRILFNKV